MLQEPVAENSVSIASPAPVSATRAARLPLLFAAAMALFIVGPALLPMPFPPYPLLRVGEVLDLATPIVVIPLAWAVFAKTGPGRPSALASVAFLVAAALWIEGQGIHLAANAIGHFAEDAEAGDLGRLVYDLDEHLSHLMWHSGAIVLSLLILLRLFRASASESWSLASGVASIVAAALYGATFFVMVTEAGTGPIGVPAAFVLGPVALVGRSDLVRSPTGTMMVGGYVVALCLFVAWAGMNGWQLVEFSDAGIIE